MYTFGIYILDFLLRIVSPFNLKIKKGVLGRRETFSKLKAKINRNDKTLWFHCASLGEYEQGLPVFQELRKKYPNHKIVLSFFSPSGYEIRKNSKVSDLVIYLPLDTPKQAARFLDLLNPELVVFVKYDIWPNLLREVRNRQLPAILISARFRKTQSYFKFYGKRLRKALFSFEHIFVQDKISETLLKSIGYNAVTVSGDTRYDRVLDQLKQDNKLDFISSFKGESLCVVIGSSWPEDEALLLPYINNNASGDLKFIIAPHEMNSNHIQHLFSDLKVKTVLFSEKENKNLGNYSVLIIDTVGYLSRIYSEADVAYVGGAMGKTGLHNVLEPAVFGIPIIIGNNYEKFPEAKAMIKAAGLTSIATGKELATVLDTILNSKKYRQSEGQKNAQFITDNKGAVEQVIRYLNKF